MHIQVSKDQNSDKVHGALIEGVEPTFETIADGSYAVSRPLFFYVKKQHNRLTRNGVVAKGVTEGRTEKKDRYKGFFYNACLIFL